MKVSLFDYDLPEELIAQYPLAKRDESRLMVLDRGSKSIRHDKFTSLIDFLSPGDLMVLNNTKVIPARLFGKKEKTGGNVEVLLLSPVGEGVWEALVKHSSRIKTGTKVLFGDGEFSAKIMGKTDVNGRLVQFESNGDFREILEKFGCPPLPPYIKREAGEEDKERYQTIYAKENGAVAAPTAGLHFTQPLFERLRAKGIRIAELTLHVGLGTFQPVKVDDVEEHDIHSEIFRIPEEIAQQINETKSSSGRIVAVGTTTLRALESSTDEKGNVVPYSGSTNIFIYPGFVFKVVDALVTNFHLPKSTLLMLVSAFASRDFIMKAYEEAVNKGYRFYSYGDAMLIL